MAVGMAIPKTKTLVTGDELMAMGDIGPCELVEGVIVKMSPTGVEHGRYEVKFSRYLDVFASGRRIGQVLSGEVGIYTHRDPDTVRAADVVFISNERLAQRKKTGGLLDIAPDLIVEILSPDDRWSDVTQKLREYFAIGVRLAWVADAASQAVYAYRSLTDVREFPKSSVLPGDDVLPGFSVPVADLFAE